MAYTVKKLSKISGVSVRTLHWYDEVGILKPAYHGQNGYRYYEEEQLLLLQQILFFRELDFSLDEIRRIVNGSAFDQMRALTVHKKALQDSLARTKKLIKTIDKTLLHLRGETKMKDAELYYGFDSEKQKAYEKELRQILKDKDYKGEDLIEESKKRTKNWKKEDWESLKADTDRIHKRLTEAMKKGLAHDSEEVQKITGEHFAMISRFYDPTKEVYIGLSQMYLEHPDFRKFYDAYDPKLAEFLAQAMNAFAESNLS